MIKRALLSGLFAFPAALLVAVFLDWPFWQEVLIASMVAIAVAQVVTYICIKREYFGH